MAAKFRASVYLLYAVCGAALLAQSISQPSGVTVAVTSTGDFSVQSGASTWTYAGTVLGQVMGIAGPQSGSDNNPISTNGLFDELAVNYVDPAGTPWMMLLRAYRDVPSATISFSPLATAPNSGPYAVLTQFPVTPHHYSNGGWNRSFGSLGWMYHDSPWLFFDDQFRASILSAASRPISQRQRWLTDRNSYGKIALEIDSSNTMLPAGDTYSHLITFGQGVGATFTAWGNAFTSIAGRHRSGNQADLSLIMPMLSTDAGASYYYVFNTALGYEGTIASAIASAKSAGIRIGVVHFDSWWYLKGGNCGAPGNASGAAWNRTRSGVWKYVADPAVFPPVNPDDPEQGFVQHLGPGMAHGRWVDTCSPYRAPILDAFGNVAVAQPVSGNVITDLGLWRRIALALKQSGMKIFEQDFLSDDARAANTFDDEKFLDAMATATGEQGLYLQYCMPMARHILAAFQYPRVHTIRVSGDRFGWRHWEEELYGSLFVNAGGIWPTVDNFLTTEKRNLLMAVLSAGPLALGDKIGQFIPVSEAVRADGLILKPDVSMVPTDASFVAEATTIEQFYGVNANGTSVTNPISAGKPTLPPLVAYTYSDFESSKVAYVFAYSRDLNHLAPVSFAPQDFGFIGQVYVYDYFNQTGHLQPAAQSVQASVDSQGSYFVIAPVGPSQVAFLGDLSKYVPASKQRVRSLSDNGQVTAVLGLRPGETVPLWFLAASQPAVSSDDAAVSPPVFDSATGLYQVTVSYTQNKQAAIQISVAGQ